MVITLLLILGLGPSWQTTDLTSVRSDGFHLAQTFRVSDDDPGVSKKSKKKKAKPKVESEKDLWGEDSLDDTQADDAEEEKKEPDDGVDVEDEVKDDYGIGEHGWGTRDEGDSWDAKSKKRKKKKRKKDPLDGELPDGPVYQDESEPDTGKQKKPEKPVVQETDVEKDKSADIAKTKKPDKSDKIEIVAPVQIDIVPPSGKMEDIARLWEERRQHIVERNFSQAQDSLEDLFELKEDLDVRNLYHMANALIREARHAQKAKDGDRAKALIDASIAMAPDLYSAHAAKASIVFSDSPFKIGAVSNSLIEGTKVAWGEPFSKNRLLVNLIIGLVLGLALAAVIFIFIEVLRYLRLFLHDFHHLFPKGVASFQTAFVGILVVLLPVIFRLGIIPLLLWLALIVWFYQQPMERIITILVLVLFAVFPLSIRWMVAGLHMPETIVKDLVTLEKGLASQENLARLKSLQVEQPDNHVLLAVLAHYHKRIGELEVASDLFDEALAIKPNSAILLNNVGNVHFLMKKLDTASDYYNRAIQESPDLAVPRYNLSRIEFARADLKKGNEHRSEALRLGQEHVRKLMDRARSGKANVVVADLPIPEEWLLTQANGKNKHREERATQYFWQAWGGIGSYKMFPYIQGAIAIFFGILLLVKRKFNFCCGCMRCGRPVCRRCSAELRDNSLCSQCFFTYTKKEQVDAASKIAKEIKVRQYRQRKESIARGITFIIPGAGQLLKDRTLKGILILVSICCLVVQFLLGPGIMRNSVDLSGGVDWIKLIPLSLVFVVFYWWAIRNIFKET
jgi:tetratricopeptide (TPR) repeat protein